MKELKERKQGIYVILEDFLRDYNCLEIFPELSIAKVFPINKRIQMLKKFNQVTNYYVPDLKLSILNKVSRIILIVFTLMLIVSSFLHFEFYIALNNPNMLIGVIVGCIVVPYSIITYFFPYLIYKSSFGDITTVEGFINEVIAINTTPTRPRLSDSGNEDEME